MVSGLQDRSSRCRGPATTTGPRRRPTAAARWFGGRPSRVAASPSGAGPAARPDRGPPA